MKTRTSAVPSRTPSTPTGTEEPRRPMSKGEKVLALLALIGLLIALPATAILIAEWYSKHPPRQTYTMTTVEQPLTVKDNKVRVSVYMGPHAPAAGWRVRPAVCEPIATNAYGEAEFEAACRGRRGELIAPDGTIVGTFIFPAGQDLLILVSAVT